MDSMLNLCRAGILLENGKIKYSGSIKSTVSAYLGGSNEYKFVQQESKCPLYISSVFFTGTNKTGIFAFTEDITFSVELKKEGKFIIDKNTVMSVIIMTLNRTRICNCEIPIGTMEDEGWKVDLRYKAKTLLPNKYLIRVVIHIPNVQFYDRQDTCTFKVCDTGTEFLKYNGSDNGLIVYHPMIQIEKNK